MKVDSMVKWWKMKKEECCTEYREELKHALGCMKKLSDNWESTNEVLRETAKKERGRGDLVVQ